MSPSHRNDVSTQRPEDLSKGHSDLSASCKFLVEASRGILGAVEGSRPTWEMEVGMAEVNSSLCPPGERHHCWRTPHEARPCKGSRNLSLTLCQTRSGCSQAAIQ